jgi:quinohemoprotein ethanol dehydrogenase
VKISVKTLALALGLGLTSLACAAVAVGAAPKQPASVDGPRIAGADKEPGQWLSVGRTYDEQRFSPLKQITAGNVRGLGIDWYADLGSVRGIEASPLMIDGVLYVTEPWNITTAFDARTGKVLWKYDPKVPIKFARIACCDIDARGLAAWKGKIIQATLDGRLIALDARTGKEVWSVQTLDEGTPWAYTVTGSPRVFDGKVLIGNAGAEAAAPGYVTAYDAETGKKAWRFHVVPPNPARGDLTKAEEMAARTWKGEWWKIGGGGTPWDSIVYDPVARLVYVGTGNGGPYNQVFRSPGGGDNLFLASVVALKVDNGDYVWHYQETPGDQWDYTSTQPIMLADLKIGGRMRKVLMHAPKNGFFYVMDRLTGELLSAEKYAPVTWAERIDLKTGRPVENPVARYGTTPISISPSRGGAHNWHPMSFNPATGLVYFPVTFSADIYAYDPDFKQVPGGIIQTGSHQSNMPELRAKLRAEMPKPQTYLVAWDPVRQKEAWRVNHTRFGSAGTLSTAGNLVFQGTPDAGLAAYRADTGDKVWQMPIQQVPIAAPISYELDGVQYIAVAAGYGGGRAEMAYNTVEPDVAEHGRLLVFKLGGKTQLPKVVIAKATLEPPPRLTGTVDDVLVGGQLYAKTCSGCHGDEARGGIKDLRRMSRQTHAEFLDIVLGGKRKERGMLSFSDVLTKEDAENIHRFLIKRTNDDWIELKNAG